jgi:hypothetical protein
VVEDEDQQLGSGGFDDRADRSRDGRNCTKRDDGRQQVEEEYSGCRGLYEPGQVINY